MFIKTHNIGIRFIIEPEDILFAGACVLFTARQFTGWGSERVNKQTEIYFLQIAAVSFIIILVKHL